MGLSTSRTNLITSLKALNARWDRLHLHWDDAVAREFHRDFVAPLEGKVRSAVAALEQMNEVLGKIRHDCR